MDSNHEEILRLKKRIDHLEAALESTKRAQLALDAADFDIWENNFVTGEVIGSNQKIFTILGYEDDEHPDNVDGLFNLIHPDDLKLAQELIQAHFRGETQRYKAEFRVKAKDGSWIWMGNYGQVKERNEAGDVTRFVGVTFNIDQRRIMEETMKSMAYTDALTDLGNRRMLFEAGGIEMERAKRYHHPFSLLITDIDGFKKINDTHGHIVGDNILVAYSDCLRHTFRHIDMKIRYGGDEFIILMPETNCDAAYESARRFNAAVAEMISELPYPITTSIGIAQLTDGDTMESLIKKADKALYQAKEQGRNTVIKRAN